MSHSIHLKLFMFKIRSCCVFISSIFYLGIACAQTPSFNFQKLGSEDGLNNSNIFKVEQHINGLMYFTTQNGIYQYDGYNFIKLQINSLKSNALQCVSIQNNDDLFISIRDEGLATYNLKTKKYNLKQQLKFSGNCDNFIITGDYGYFLNTGSDLKIVDFKNNEIINDAALGKDKYNSANCIYKTIGNKILVGRKDGLYELNGKDQIKLDYVKNASVYSIAQSNDGKLIIGSSGNIYIINNNVIEKEIVPVYKAKAITFLLNGERNIEKLITDNYGRIWFTSSPGQNLYLYQNNTVYDVFETLGLPPTLINCIYKDRNQNIWVGTFSEGAYFIQNPHFNSFNFLFNQKTLNVNSVYLKNNLLVAGTSNGLYGLNLNNNQSKVLSKPDDIFNEPIGNINEIDNILYYSSRSDLPPTMFSDSKFSYRFKSIQAAQFYPIDKNRIVVADRVATVLLYNANATQLLDTLISFTNYRISINALLKKNDSLYVATGNGLYVYDFKSKTHKQIIRQDLNYIINDLAIVNGNLFAAHESGITNISSKQLVQQIGNVRLNGVKKIKQFNDQIWLATLDGVYICDKNWAPIKILNKTNGLLSNSVSDIVFNNETVCIATARGVAIANINFILNESSKLNPVILNNVTVNGDTVLANNNLLNLNSTQENITVQFYSPQFNKPNKQLYRYRLDNGEWNKVNDNSIALSIATGGKHIIEISASLDNINWSESTTVNLDKEAKISESNWIYLVIIFVGLLLIAGISLLILKSIKAKAKKRLEDEQQVNVLKHQAMNALLSPHFIFNSLTSIQNYINSNNSLKASEYLAKFSRLIRMIIEKASQREITLQDELARLTYYLELEKERFKNKFDFDIYVDDKLNQVELKIPNMIIQPHVENCIIHGILPKMEHGSLDISFKKMDGNKLRITIEDDGIGHWYGDVFRGDCCVC